MAMLTDEQVDYAAQMGDDYANESTAEAIEEPERLSESEVQGIVKQMLQDAAGGGETDDRGASGSIALALDYYFGRRRGDEIDGRSEQQSLDVADVVDSALAEITPIFANSTQVIFGALGPQDEDQAQEEGDVVNHVVMQQNQGYTLLFSYVKDALLQKNGVIEVYIDEWADVLVDEYKSLNQFEVLQAMQPKYENETTIVVMREDAPEGTNLEIKRVMRNRKLCCDPVAPEDFLYYSAQESVNLERCPFSARRTIVTRSYLLERGYPPNKVNKLSKFTSRDDQVSLSRNQFNVNDSTRHTSSQHATDPIEIYRCYCNIDEDGDGIAELRHIVVAGKNQCEILRDVPATHVPFAAGTGIIQPHRFLGLSLFDKTWDIQDGKTQDIRMWDDNQNTSNNPGLIPNMEQVEDPDTLMNAIPARVIPVMGDARTAVATIPITDIGPSCANKMDYYDKILARRVGASVDAHSQGGPIPGNIGSQGLDRLMTAGEKMTAMLARNLGETGIRNLYLLVHKTLRLGYQGEMQVKIGGNWVTSNPQRWRPRTDVEIRVGMSGSERAREMAVLDKIFQDQLTAMEQGKDGILVNDEKIHNNRVDYARLGDLSHPERYWIDPASPEAQQRMQQNAMQGQEVSQKQEAAALENIQAQTAIAQAELIKAQSAAMRVQLQSRIEAMKVLVQDLSNQAESANDNAELAYKYAELANQHQQWLTELEAEYNRDFSQQAAENTL